MRKHFPWAVVCVLSTLSTLSNASSISVFTATSATLFASSGSDPSVQGEAQFVLNGKDFFYGGNATALCSFCSSGIVLEPGQTVSVTLESFSEGFDFLSAPGISQGSLLSGGSLSISGGTRFQREANPASE